MPKAKTTTRILFDGSVNESSQNTTIQSAIKRRETPQIGSSITFDDRVTITTSTPFPDFENSSKYKSSTLKHLKVLRNPVEQSILINSQRRKSRNFESKNKKRKTVMFTNPQVMEISAIDEQMKQSFKNIPPKGTPIRPPSRIKPRLLNFTESASKLDIRKSKVEKVEPKVKRLTHGKKTSPIQQQQQKENIGENILKGVKLNRRFELLMKNLLNGKKK